VVPSRVMQNRQCTHRNGTRAHVDVQVAISDRWFSAFWLEIAGFSLIDAEGQKGDLEGFVFPMGPNGELPKMRLFRSHITDPLPATCLA
jgi:hypothetical protein